MPVVLMVFLRLAHRPFAAWPVLALLALSLPLQPAHAEPAPAPVPGDVSSLPDQAQALLGLADHPSAGALDRAVSSFIDRPNGPGPRYREVVPPESIYRAIDPVCDLDGDSAPDLVTNDLQIQRAGQFDAGTSEIRALSGGDGRQLWSQDNMRYATLTLNHGFSSTRPGQPHPDSPPNVIPTPDVNGDGVCDILAYGYDNDAFSIDGPLFGVPNVHFVDVTIRMLDGRNGTTLWSNLVQATIADVSEPIFNTVANQAILGFPTGFLYFQTAEGPRFIVKTTDVRYNYAHDWTGLSGVAFDVDRDGTYVVNTQTAEHYLEGDATNGQTLWTRTFGAGSVDAGLGVATPPIDPEADQTNITWISGLANLDGDAVPDLVVDQFTLSNPRGSEVRKPAALGEGDLYKNGRGMRMMALSGAKQGEPLWSTIILDPLAVQTPPPNEESLEILAWTYGTVLPGVDGAPDVPVAQYLTQDMVGGTPNGRHRTHFLPLDAGTGQPVWQHVQQGWGFLTRLGDNSNGPVLAAATLDIPAKTDSGAGFSAKSARYSGLEADTGHPLWSVETPFGQDSAASYEIGLQQVQRALAPLDLDGDGLLDPVSVSQYIAPAGHDQVFLATAEQSFQVFSGATGKPLRELTVWGSNGLVLPCGNGTGDQTLTLALGHAKRIDLVRISLQTGLPLWRRAIWNYVEARSSTEGMDLLAMDGVCRDLPSGDIAYGINMEAYSFFRQYEIVPLLGMVSPNGTAIWRNPEIVREPPTPSLLDTLHEHATLVLPPGSATWIATIAAAVVGAAGGWLASGPVGRALARRRRRLDPLGIALLLILVPAGLVPGGGPAEPAVDAHGVAALPVQDLLQTPGPQAAERATVAAPDAADGPPPVFDLPSGSPLGRFISDAAGAPDAAATVRAMTTFYAAEGYTPDVSDRFDENQTLTYPLNIGDQDGDGVDDIALDVYCTDGTSCYDAYPGLINDPVASVQQELRQESCGPHHRLVVVSGARGDRLWDAPLDRPHPLSIQLTYTCGAETVIGTVPLPDNGTGILIERYEAIDAFEGFTGRTINTTLYLLDAGTGAARWRLSEPGYVTPDVFASLNRAQLAQSALLNVFLTHGEAGRTPDRTAGAGLSLLVQGIGYEVADVNPFLTPPGFGDTPRVLDDYRPREWLMRVDPVSGEVLWRADTFTPSPDRSVFPIPPVAPSFRQPNDYADTVIHSPYSYPLTVPVGVPERHWSDSACCGDLNGDGVADVVFSTVEWNPLANGKLAGPHTFDGRLVAYDGATGAKLFDPKVVSDLPGEQQRLYYSGFPVDSFGLATQAIGDADGDGKADILVHLVIMASDPVWTISVRSGATGEELWSRDFPRAQFVLPLGDVDGDGGNDLLFFQWFGLERIADHTKGFAGPYTNVTAQELFIRSGATGSVLRVDHTVSAPVDLAYIFRNAALNGLPDLDRDGVGDLPVDDPVYLPDQVTLHKVSYLSGRTGKVLMSFPAAGAFAYPVRLADVTGDGRDEIALLAGDASDLWVTYHDGADGHALWSHRALPLKSSSYVWAVPRLEFIPMVTGPGAADRGFLMDLHMDVQTIIGEGTIYYISVGGTSGATRYISVDDQTIPQLTAVLDAQGGSSWSYPSGGDIDASRQAGAAPGTLGVLQLRARISPGPASVATRVLGETWLPLTALAVAFAVVLVPLALIVRRKGGVA